MNVKCPRCGKPALFAPENAFRPFCSERCKLIDLGKWADESYKIPLSSPVDIDASEEASETDAGDEIGEPYDDDSGSAPSNLH